MRNKDLINLHMPEEWYQQVIEMTKEGIWIVDSMFLTTFVNSSTCRILGYESPEMIGKHINEFIFDEERESQQEEMQKRRDGINGLYLRRFRCKDGRECWCSLTGTTILDDNRKFVGALAMLIDLTEKVANEKALRREVKKYETLLKTAADGIHILDLSGNVIQANDSFCKMLGFAPEEVVGMNVSKWDAHFSAEELKKRIPDHMRRSATFETRHRKKDGEIIDVDVSTVGIDIDGQQMLFCASRDISVRKRAEESMKLASLIYQSSEEAVMVTDHENSIIDINPAFTRQTGYRREEVIGRNPGIFQSSHHDHKFYKEMWGTLLSRGNWQGEIWDFHKDGSPQTLFCNIGVIKDDEGRVFRHVAQFHDITQKKKKEEETWKQANYDALTDLPNRRLFLDRLEQQMRLADRACMPLALLFIDLDRFKEINDTMGHAKGDALLKEAAQRIVRCVRESDTVARVGGDEFTIIVQEFSGRENIGKLGHALLHTLSLPFMLGQGIEGFISASIGIAMYPVDGGNIEELIKHADQAMYAAKRGGRNQLSFFHHSMQTAAQEKLSLNNDLRYALARGELEIYYQPIVCTTDGAITKAEALLRWIHPVKGIISPDVFIPLAEESGMIVEIGDWVFGEVIASIKQWQEKCGPTIQVSVNMSPVQFEREECFRWFDNFIDSGLPPGSITIEITEGLLIKNIDIVKRKLIECRDAGIEVSIDDFGTGFSALSYLKEFHIDCLKIDRSFVRDLGDNRALVEAIIVMAGKLGMTIITEGVETKDQLDLLRTFGSDYVQGFLFSPAIKKDELERMLEIPSSPSLANVYKAQKRNVH